jgi:hypothetical protein
MAEKRMLTVSRVGLNKWGISSYRAEGAKKGATVRFSKGCFEGEPPTLLDIVAEGLQAEPAAKPKPVKAARPRAIKAKKATPEASGESGATVEAPTAPGAPIVEPEPVPL